ncbi:MAG: hypothetical protein FJ399_04500 [Verrucomicrobia bacterium]|nr:hypothetical protein [Verrucomicrobiota bacterium]
MLVLIGSRARPPTGLGAADPSSDWDFQVATTEPQILEDKAWLADIGSSPLAYVHRPGRLGSASKVSAVLAAGELDLVILPVRPLEQIAQLVQAGRQPTEPEARRALSDLAAVLAGGYRILKGAKEFLGLYDWVKRELPPGRLEDDAVCRIAEGFVCDYVFTRRKVAQGELLAAQRWLHQHLAEANFRLLHELRLRRNEVSFPDARRLERLQDQSYESVKVAAMPDAPGLLAAVEHAASAHRELVAALLHKKWNWPALPLTPER